MCAEWYQKLRALSKANAEDLLTKAVIPSRSEQVEAFKNALPLIADEVIDSDPIYLQLCDPEIFKRTKERIIDKWEDIQACAENIPDPIQLRAWIARLGGPVTAGELDLSEEQEWLGKEFSHYLRERFSINIIRKLFGWD